MTEEKIIDLYLPYSKMKDRLVRVYVPAHEEGEKLPVIYMTDGQNLFEEEKCRFGCWHIRETVREELAQSGKGVIVVGIYNDKDAQRASELTPKGIGKPQFPNIFVKIMVSLMARPSGEVFDSFIINTVKPYIETNFPVKTGRNHTAFCGSSMGGLMSFFTALSHTDIFCMAGVFSPNFMIYDKEDMKEWVKSKLTKNMPYLYMYMGNGSGMESELYPAFKTTCDTLKDVYPREFYKEAVKEDAVHSETAWEPVFKDFLRIFLSNTD